MGATTKTELLHPYFTTIKLSSNLHAPETLSNKSERHFKLSFIIKLKKIPLTESREAKLLQLWVLSQETVSFQVTAANGAQNVVWHCTAFCNGFLWI